MAHYGSVTLPKTQCLTPDWPCVHMAIRLSGVFFPQSDNLVDGDSVLGDRGHLLDAHLFDGLGFLFHYVSN